MGTRRPHQEYHSPEERKAARLEQHKVYNRKRSGKKKLLKEVSSCNSCQSNFDAMVLQENASRELHLLLGSHTNSSSFDWPDEVTVCQIPAILTQALFMDRPVPSEIMADPLFVSTFVTPVHLRILRLPHVDLPPKAETSIKGGKIQKDFTFDPKTMLSNPGDGTIGLVIIDRKDGHSSGSDLVFFGSSGLRNEDIVTMGQEENASIKDMVKGERQGAASGFFLLPHNTFCYDSRSLSAATRNDRILSRGTTNLSTAASVHYTNATGDRKHYGSAYRDMNMSRLSKGSKRLAALKSDCYRRVLIKEMSSRIRVLSVCQLLNLTPPWDGEVPVSSVWDKLIAAIHSSSSDSFKQWQVGDPTLSHWEVVLLQWATSTGEMRNHEACSTHVDGNTAHFLETMWLGGKVDSKDPTTSSTKVKLMTNGQLALPLHGVVFDICCGSDLLHLALSNTMHAPDETRDRCNYSRVHGP